MTARQRRVIVLAAAMAVSPRGMVAQGYRARIDLQAQASSFRGVILDSILSGTVVTGSGGGLQTADGYAVRCPGSTPYCFFFRPGAVQQGGPITAALDMQAWGFGIRGVSVHGNARVAQDFGGADIWPGTRPAVQLLEGYAEYASPAFTARAGREQTFNRLGSVGYDGASIVARHTASGLDAGVYGGFGLARALAVPINSPALNPLDQYQPSRRQWVIGGSVGWRGSMGSARLLYQREVDRRSRYFISERGGLDVTIQPPLRGLRLSGGADYDMAAGTWGSAEGRISFARGPLAVSVGGRRYRPFFELWTIWGAFSPTPFRAASASVWVSPAGKWSFSAWGERYQFDETGAETPLVDIRDDGWRWSVGAEGSPHENLDLSAGYRREIGFGAGSSGFDAAVTYHRTDAFALTVHGATLERPLELRFDDSSVQMIGLRMTGRPNPHLTVSAGAGRFRETRERPDAASFDWNQTRLDIRVTLTLGTAADRGELPPALPRVRR